MYCLDFRVRVRVTQLYPPARAIELQQNWGAMYEHLRVVPPGTTWSTTAAAAAAAKASTPNTTAAAQPAPHHQNTQQGHLPTGQCQTPSSEHPARYPLLSHCLPHPFWRTNPQLLLEVYRSQLPIQQQHPAATAAATAAPLNCPPPIACSRPFHFSGYIRF